MSIENRKAKSSFIFITLELLTGFQLKLDNSEWLSVFFSPEFTILVPILSVFENFLPFSHRVYTWPQETQRLIHTIITWCCSKAIKMYVITIEWISGKSVNDAGSLLTCLFEWIIHACSFKTSVSAWQTWDFPGQPLDMRNYEDHSLNWGQEEERWILCLWNCIKSNFRHSLIHEKGREVCRPLGSASKVFQLSGCIQRCLDSERQHHCTGQLRQTAYKISYSWNILSVTHSGLFRVRHLVHLLCQDGWIRSLFTAEKNWILMNINIQVYIDGVDTYFDCFEHF